MAATTKSTRMNTQQVYEDQIPKKVEKTLPELSERQREFLVSLTESKQNDNRPRYGISKECEETFHMGYNSATLYNNASMYSDLRVMVGNNTEVLDLHRAVLAVHSDYFRQLFEEERENLAVPNTILVLRAPVELEAEYNDVVKFLYTGEITVKKFSVFKYLFLSKMLACKDLKELCLKFLHSQLEVTLEASEIPIVSTDHMYRTRQKEDTDPKKITVSQISNPKDTYSIGQVQGVWDLVPELRETVLLWFASQLKNSYDRNYEVLTTEQMCAVLDCDVYKNSEFNLFRCAENWMEKHTEVNVEEILCKIRYAYMSPSDRRSVMQSKYVKGKPNLMQAVIYGSFWHEQLENEKSNFYTKTFNEEMKKNIPEFQKKVYTPRKLTTGQAN